MGLYSIQARFEGEPPSEAAFRAELRGEVGNDDGLDGYTVDGNLVELRTTVDPVTLPYAAKVLQRFGGTVLDRRTREPVVPNLPKFVSRPWNALPLWTRFAVHLVFQLGLITSALGQRIF